MKRIIEKSLFLFIFLSFIGITNVKADYYKTYSAGTEIIFNPIENMNNYKYSWYVIDDKGKNSPYVTAICNTCESLKFRFDSNVSAEILMRNLLDRFYQSTDSWREMNDMNVKVDELTYLNVKARLITASEIETLSNITPKEQYKNSAQRISGVANYLTPKYNSYYTSTYVNPTNSSQKSIWIVSRNSSLEPMDIYTSALNNEMIDTRPVVNVDKVYIDSNNLIQDPTKIKINNGNISMVVGNSNNISANITTRDSSTSKELVWSVGNPNIASFNASTFKLTALAPGTTTLTAKSKINEVSDTITITVAKKTISEANSMYIYKTLNLSNKLTGKNIKWTSSNKEIASVSDTGLVTALKTGSVTITGSSDIENYTIVLSIEKSTEDNKTEKESFIVSQDDVIDLSNKVDDKKNVKWTSSDTSIATVDENGKVTFLKEGKVEITAFDENGEVKYKAIIESLKSVENKPNGNVLSTNISLLAKEDEVSENAYLDIKEILKDESKYKEIQSKIKNVNKFELYDIKLKENDVIIQPKKDVILVFDIPQGFDINKIAIIRVEDDGSFTKLETKLVNGKLQAKTNHFSDYIIAELSNENTTTKDINKTETESDIKNPQTGAVLSFTVLVTGMITGFGIYRYTNKKKLFKRL